jgi:hypothetical protein
MGTPGSRDPSWEDTGKAAAQAWKRVRNGRRNARHQAQPSPHQLGGLGYLVPICSAWFAGASSGAARRTPTAAALAQHRIATMTLHGGGGCPGRERVPLHPHGGLQAGVGQGPGKAAPSESPGPPWQCRVRRGGIQVCSGGAGGCSDSGRSLYSLHPGSSTVGWETVTRSAAKT